MAEFKVVTPKGTSFAVAGGGYEYEKEALIRSAAEIVEIDASSENAFIAAAHDADAVYAKGRNFTKRMIDGLERCKLIALGTVGSDYVDVAAATARGIPVTNVPDTFIEEVADHAMMLLLASFRRLVVQDRMVRDGRWPRGGRRSTSRASWGRRWASSPSAMSRARRRCGRAPFGLPHARLRSLCRRAGDDRPTGSSRSTLEELLKQSDFVSMHAPATEDAQRMLTEKHFRMMKPTALFINTGRGATVDEAALIKALQEGWIAGAGLDVLETEPPKPDNPLLKMDNVILTAACGVGLGPVRPGAAAPRRPGDRAGRCEASGRAPASIPPCWRRPSSSAGSPTRWSAARRLELFE